MNYTTSQGTAKVVNPETNGQAKPARNKIQEVEVMLNQVMYTIPLTNEQKLRLWTVCLIHQLGWRATHEQIEARLNEQFKNEPHAVEEVESQYECEMCDEGVMDLGYGTPFDKQPCTCCNGNWQDCQNCKPVEKVTPTDIAIASARYNVENASPKNKAWAEKRLEEELQKAKGVDWSKVPEVIQPDEINWNRFIERGEL